MYDLLSCLFTFYNFCPMIFELISFNEYKNITLICPSLPFSFNVLLSTLGDISISKVLENCIAG